MPTDVVIKSTPDTFALPPGFPAPAPSEKFIYTLAAPFLELSVPARPGLAINDIPDGSQVLPKPVFYLGFNDASNLGLDSAVQALALR